MSLFQIAWADLVRFRDGISRVVPLALALIPLLYGSLYLWSNWDPYGRLDTMPVAVVNQDEPTTVDGQKIDAGAQFVSQLEHERTFDWKFVDADEALDGLKKGRYYFTITVPRDFSAKLVSPAGSNPERAAATITLNDANSFTAGIMAKTVQTKLEEQINAAAYSAYASRVLGDISTLRDQLTQASQGAVKLRDGARQAESGATQLVTGLTQLDQGATELASANQQIADGTRQLATVVNSVADVVVADLPAATKTFADAATTANTAAEVVADGAQDAASRAQSVSDNITAFGQQHPEIASDPLYIQIKADAADAAQRASAFNQVAQDNYRTTQQVMADAQALQARTPQIQAQVRDAANQTTQLADGAQQAATGAADLKTGLDQALTGEQKLQQGLVSLTGGTTELADKLTAGMQKIPPLTAAERAQAADVLGSPSDVRLTNLNPATIYGRGMAPFFFAIALWVFGMLTFQFLRPVNRRALAGRASSIVVSLAGYLPAVVIGIAGAMLLYLVVDIGLGLDPVNPLGMIGLLALAVAAFVAINHFLRVVLGVVGEAISLVLLMLQLTSSGGLYPTETTPLPFQILHPVMPMTYLVDGLRVTVSGGQTGHLVRDAVVLGAIAVVFAGLSVLAVSRQRTWTMGRLKPVLE